MAAVIPLRDASRRPTRVPWVTAAIIALNVLVFVLELSGGDEFIMRWALIPAVAAVPPLTVPMLGASGAIAAVMGAFIVTYPRDRIRSLLIILVFVSVTYIPAVLLIGIWFLMQFLNLGAVTSEAGGAAYAAHVGGSIFGAVSARLFERSS